MRFLRPGARTGIHGSTRSSAWSTEFGLRFLVCHINQNALDRFDCQRPCDRRRSRRSLCFFKTSFVESESSIHTIVALITGRHSKAMSLAQTQLPLPSLSNGLDAIMTRYFCDMSPYIPNLASSRYSQKATTTIPRLRGHGTASVAGGCQRDGNTRSYVSDKKHNIFVNL